MNNLFLNSKKAQYIIKNTPVLLLANNQSDVLFFRRLLETAHRKGFWWGILGEG
jgi:hypothetical protein